MNQKGFTMIELVVVIVILGILAAVAVPKFVDLQKEAREASLDGTLGAMKAAASMTYAKALVAGQTGATGTVTINGSAISVVYGYPADGDALESVLEDLGNFTQDTTDTELFLDNGAPTATQCSITYVPATGATAPASFTTDKTGC